jgi:hypothetical protein
VVLSMTEAEYLAACAVAVWLRELLSGLFGLGLEATCIWCDNQSCMKSSENPVVLQKGAVRLQYVATDEQVVDVLTKPLSRMKFEYFRDKLDVVPLQRE